MITITKQDPLIIIDDGSVIIYQSKDQLAGGFDIISGNAIYMQRFTVPLTDLNMNSTPITNISDFQTAMTALTT